MMRNELEILLDGRLRYLFWMDIVSNDGVSNCKYTGLAVRDGSPSYSIVTASPSSLSLSSYFIGRPRGKVTSLFTVQDGRER